MAKIRRGRRPQHRELLGDPNDPRSWEAILPAYLTWRAVRGFSASGQKSINSVLRLFGEYCCQRGLESPTLVTRELLERYQRHLFTYRRGDQEKPLSIRTQSIRLSTLKTFYGWLLRSRYLAVDPSSSIELPKEPVRLPVDSFSPEEIEQIMMVPDIKTALGIRNRALLELLYSTGARRMELAALQEYDVDFARGIVTIRQGKGGKDRVVPIGDRALAWVRKYLEDVRPELVIDPQETTLFVSEAGERFNKDALGLLVARLIERSGVRKRQGACHLFRHTVATQMLSNGADIRYIQEMLGHARLETTQVYTKVSIEKLKAIHAATHPGAHLKSGHVPAPATIAEDLRVVVERLELEAAEDPDELARPGKLRAYHRRQ
jgi:integrase/recombinase XerD